MSATTQAGVWRLCPPQKQLDERKPRGGHRRTTAPGKSQNTDTRIQNLHKERGAKGTPHPSEPQCRAYPPRVSVSRGERDRREKPQEKWLRGAQSALSSETHSSPSGPVAYRKEKRLGEAQLEATPCTSCALLPSAGYQVQVSAAVTGSSS